MIQLHLVINASTITPTIFMPDDLPVTTLTIYHGLGQALGYAGLQSRWLDLCA